MFKSLLSVLLLTSQVILPAHLTADHSNEYAPIVEYVADAHQTSSSPVLGSNMPDGSFSPCGPLIGGSPTGGGGTIGGSHIHYGGIGCPPVEVSTRPTEPVDPTDPSETTPPVLEPPTIEIDVESLPPTRGFSSSASRVAAFNGNVNEVEIGDTLRYGITLSNPNNVAIQDFLVFNTLNVNLIEFISGSVTINGSPVAQNHQVFNGVTGELLILLPELSANATYTINFDAIALAGNNDNAIPLTARLYGNVRPNETPVFINEVDVTVTVTTETDPTESSTAAPTDAATDPIEGSTAAPTDAATDPTEGSTTAPTDVATDPTETTTESTDPAEVSFLVTFDLNGGTGETLAQSVSYGGFATEPTVDPIREGYTFLGWFYSGEDTPFNFTETPIIKHTALIARWRCIATGVESTEPEPTEPELSAPPGGGNVNLPQTGAAISVTLGIAGTSFITAGSTLVIKEKIKKNKL